MNRATTTSLAERLRHDTAALHRQAEASPLMSALIAGTIERATYVELLHNLHALYVALESALVRHRTDVRLGFARAPPLPRAALIAQDLVALATDDARVPVELAPATTRYVQHLAALAEREPLRLIAHAYVRYLGDLYGGQQLARGLRERFGLAGAEGTRFYDFGPPQALPALRAGFRGALDALPISTQQADAVVDEARAAFERHVELFEQLSRGAAPRRVSASRA